MERKCHPTHHTWAELNINCENLQCEWNELIHFGIWIQKYKCNNDMLQKFEIFSLCMGMN